jgi:hypothetical protein
MTGRNASSALLSGLLAMHLTSFKILFWVRGQLDKWRPLSFAGKDPIFTDLPCHQQSIVLVGGISAQAQQQGRPKQRKPGSAPRQRKWWPLVLLPCTLRLTSHMLLLLCTRGPGHFTLHLWRLLQTLWIFWNLKLVQMGYEGIMFPALMPTTTKPECGGTRSGESTLHPSPPSHCVLSQDSCVAAHHSSRDGLPSLVEEEFLHSSTCSCLPK